MIRAQILLTAAAFCGATFVSCPVSAEEGPESLLPRVSELRGLFQCISGQPLEGNPVLECAMNEGITEDELLTGTASPADVAVLRAANTWYMTGGGATPDFQLSSTDFDQAVSYAECVETAAFAQLSVGQSSERDGPSFTRAVIACDSPQQEILGGHLDAADDNALIVMSLARIVAGVNHGYLFDHNQQQSDTTEGPQPNDANRDERVRRHTLPIPRASND